MNAGETVATLSGVTQRYGNTIALDDVSIALPAGCMVGLIGPDGVGKSTLLALLSGVRAIQRGAVCTLGGDMAEKRHRNACFDRIAYMPQGLGKNLYPTLSIFENLDFFGRLFGQPPAEREARIDELLAATGLAPFRDRPAGKLSGGMKQKLGLCCALIHDPDLLVLDEPTTGVDPLSRQQFWALIDRFRERRADMSVIVATAYMEEAERFDWLAAMDAGRVIATGSPGELLVRTETDNLEAAFIRLLPEEKRGRHSPVRVPERSADGGRIAIAADGLTKRFGDFTAVDHVSFAIEQGEIFGFLGSNGCGKTTTMKMLTGLLPASEGEAKLFGKTLDARDRETRRRVGYMSQAFSLYEELTVMQNLELHAHLFHLTDEAMRVRLRALLDQFELEAVRDAKPAALPLGVRQRLQLAVAVLHEPEMLILDEPTSGVDPVARDEFWRLLIRLSREDGVTIFISTHFMNEAERCDRISLMHAGKVLAVGAPDALVRERGAESLDAAFVAWLEEAIGDNEAAEATPEQTPARHAAKVDVGGGFNPRRMWAYAARETMELLRDPIRLAFALIGPIVLMITFGFGISFDVEQLPYAVLDQDRSRESRAYLENFASSRYFEQRPDIVDTGQSEQRLKSGELKFAIEVPEGFGKALLQGRTPQIAVWLDGAMPFRAETASGYIEGVTSAYAATLAVQEYGSAASADSLQIVTRYRYNPAFESVYAITPGVVMLLCMMIPAMMTSVGIVREKEMGSITNLYATPVTRAEFLLGKQLPYMAIAYASFVSLVSLVVFAFGVPVTGSVSALALGAVLYAGCATGFGLLISAFVNSQIAAIFATAILAIVPAINFSGFLTPVSTLGGGAHFMGLFFPTSWFQSLSVGAITKGLGFAQLVPNIVVLGVIAVVLFSAAAFFLRKQEK